ncbi:helix-turn-helix domain-containing protein [Thiorhodococcus mannitoliphagus]|uniref:Helix-turn-helix domain-containing protein n=1 Tax=Thiorhodococcus mannitoliphagus TaxID=329406 RepID=A0A6P1DWV9_9GAMM|nr:helix-turn-helix domain-containing protein [Thiorhodococcus mannitoliphagus]NEX22169.1 helix-turn-helix domain-containing protein [Thiorhodococcus mannitoliphagus]
MRTLDLTEAADFLRLHPETLRRLAACGDIPSAKPGKHWVFIDEDLANWLRARYAEQARAVEPRGKTRCSTADPTAGTGGSASPHQTAKKYDALLERKTRKPPRSTKRN